MLCMILKKKKPLYKRNILNKLFSVFPASLT